MAALFLCDPTGLESEWDDVRIYVSLYDFFFVESESGLAGLATCFFLSWPPFLVKAISWIFSLSHTYIFG